MSGGVLEIPAFVIGVAGVFTSCIDAFNYFKFYQGATRDIEVVLLKLDIEKARLLIWGENVDILSANPRDSPLLNQGMAELIKDILSMIQGLLTDSEKLRTQYGVRASDSSVPRMVDYISKKSLAIFTPSRSRFLARNSSALASFTRGSAAARTKWAIHDREKFQGLVIYLAHFVDSLFELAKIDREVPDRVIVEDIESIVDVSHLAIVEEGTENYPTYLEAAKSARASTEAGTLDRRTLEEEIRDAEGIPAVHPRATAGAHNASELSSLPSEIQHREKYFVLTSPCRRQTTGELCDVRVLGSQVADMELSYPSYGFQRFRWDVSTRSGTGCNTIGCLVQDAIGVKKVVQDEVEDGILGNLLRIGADSQEATPEQEAFIHAKLPLLQVYVYCAPCVCLLHTAIELCRSLESPFVKAQFRPDSRLAASCCSTVDRSEGMRRLSEWVRDWEAEATTHQSNIIATHLDMAWLDQRLEHLDYEQPYNFQESADVGRRYLILGEADHTSHMVQKAPGRIPTATDIWHFKPNFLVATRTLASRFSEYRPPRLATQGTQSGSLSTPGPTPSPATPFAQPASRRRPASPSSSASASRRPRYDVESPSVGSELEEGESIARSMAEDMEI
ncbi:prion-inhibition and propagation-domain-containing protein [Chaetomidium leptoderma]|uniref:Prion-inhibition and propagation-domain-containing protein n=1 Tax=Chaetomidium leptoderma TaxID=669021 RepID=A0AAN6VNI5_9PEZI|nr:prion-inhibition and propagation-domain-containing protein [Chaetomidium leptoderma]